MPWPLRYTPIDFANPDSQSSSLISEPSGANHMMSGSPSPPRLRTGPPEKKRRRRNTGCAARSPDTDRVNSIRSVSACSQSIHDSSLSWQYTLLLPC